MSKRDGAFEVWYGQNCAENLRGHYASLLAARKAAVRLTRAYGTTINRVVITVDTGILRRELYALEQFGGEWETRRIS